MAVDPESVVSALASLRVQMREGDWALDSKDDFFEYHAQSGGGCDLHLQWEGASLLVQCNGRRTRVKVSGSSREFIRSIFEVFELAVSSGEAVLTDSRERPMVFIAHGGSSQQWRILKDHLADLHGVSVQAFESGARAGHAIRDILDELSAIANFAIIVMTAEDEMSSGQVRARQNVIHEAGLFQGKLGFSRAIVLREAGTETFSNIDGIQRIEFSKGNIRETFGEVLATLKREFGE